jgi:hypothetical protein
MNWGKWIIVAFVLFTGFIAILVTVCMRQEINLVSKEYYREELAYQDQILRMNNANKLDKKPAIQKAGTFLTIDFDHFNKIENGKLKLFSPSDPKKDKVFILNASEGNQQSIPVDNLAKGMYRAQMQWNMNGQEYFVETVVNI